MHTSFTSLDWLVLALYVAALACAGWATTRRQQRAEDYFLDGHHAPTWLVAISMLSTVQSAATFLGVPDSSYRGSYVYLGGVLASLLAAWIVANVLVPRFYALKVTTVYELLEARFDARARKAAAGMFIVGRIFASGSRLYLAAIAVSMILFLDIAPHHLLIATILLLVLGLAFTLMGGLHSVIWSDLVQVVLYVGAALIAAALLWSHLPFSTGEAIARLMDAPGGSKLALADFSFNLSSPWSLPAVLIGVTLLNTASSGLDQDTTQRLLACRDARQGTRALYRFVAISLPVIALFLVIGSLLWLTYQGNAGESFRGEKVTVFMHWILTEMPAGLRGLAVVGVLAAAAMNSELIAMAAVIVGDFYRPFAERRGPRSEAHFVRAGRIASVVVGLALSAMAMLSYYWQHYADAALLDFVLGVMAFAYSGLLGVYAIALFTRRGNSASVIAALAAGFVTVLLFQPWIVDTFGLPAGWRTVAFPWQLTIGTLVAAAVCALGRPMGKAVRVS
ncbi:sodium:solute symporter family transporter [Parablastomonas sp. CN1-191]|uniref:sodium:solute symporter family transporter n=1 Tax=Parablastomonas sp. CN1-191 TaxID=3400908 RepID=UPI003BF7A77D